MCGIGGAWVRASGSVDPSALDRMSAAMRERGPDDQGEYLAPGIGLVHRRLSILDLSPAGRCPISNDDGSIQVVHNGEIYNFAELRRELEGLGHRFRSSGDSEVVVRAYEQWGTEVAKRMLGMFAIAIWDAKRRRLVLMRDRLGQKPLYLLTRSDRVTFASTLNAIRAHENGRLEVDPRAVECFLSHGFIPHPHTVWGGVESLPPGHIAVVEGDSALRIEPYWQLPDAPARRIGVEAATDAVEEALERSVRRRLIADVPVGGFLSGGVDSSLVMALAAKHSPRIDTFSIGFEDDPSSELPHAKRVAEHIGSTHHELVLDVDVIDDLLPELVWQYGQPFGDVSAVPTFLVSRLARESVTVALSGDGGDESFAGYWRAEAGRYAAWFGRALPRPIRRDLVPLVVAALSRVGGGGLSGRLAAMNTLSLARPGAGYTNSESWLDHRGDLLGDRFATRDASHIAEACRTGRPCPVRSASVLQQILFDDFQVLLPDAYLVKVDVASMAASLEVRSPFLDHELVELAWTLPDSLKLRGSSRKWLLKRLAARHVPREVVYRPKQGFAPPMQAWWGRGLTSVLDRLMGESRSVALGWIRAEPVMRALREHASGARDHSTRLWLILWLELWVRIVLEGSLDRSASLRTLR
jgi:asparagine synthase (glutamine-hydrolysing)